MAKNDFDRILRENIQEIFVHYVEGILGLEIVKSDALPTKLTGTIENEVDHLVMATSNTGEQFILHFEFQTNNDLKMLRRISRYHGILFHKYGLPIHHFVIYLGQKKASMRTKLEGSEVFSEFHLIPIATQKLEGFLSARNPEEVLLGILSDFGSKNAAVCIQQIVNVLQNKSQDEIQLKRYLIQLKILARIRKLENVVHEVIEKMPIFLDITDSYDYQQGEKAGRLKTIVQLVSTGMISIENAAETLGISIEDMNEKVEELNKNSEPE